MNWIRLVDRLLALRGMCKRDNMCYAEKGRECVLTTSEAYLSDELSSMMTHGHLKAKGVKQAKTNKEGRPPPRIGDGCPMLTLSAGAKLDPTER